MYPHDMYPKETQTKQQGIGAPTPQPSTAIQVLSYADRLADQAGSLASVASDKLGPLILQTPQTNVARDNDVMETYPEYFNQLRDKLRRIELAFVTHLADTVQSVEM